MIQLCVFAFDLSTDTGSENADVQEVFLTGISKNLRTPHESKTVFLLIMRTNKSLMFLHFKSKEAELFTRDRSAGHNKIFQVLKDE